MGYVIKLNHRKGRPPMFLGAVPVATDRDDQARAMERKGLRVEDVETKSFKTLEEASNFPFLTAEEATEVLRLLPPTQNIGYELVATGDDLDESMESWTKN